MRASEELAGATVVDTDGTERALGDLWRERPALLLWVRHFG
ncbi:MAG TPA: hypothetical protein VN947_29055 [Polyangia bacterium]|nr:hypothetical protein [Polyangia bacterium]